MRDVDERVAGRAPLADQREQLLALRLTQRRRRLVEHDDLRAIRQRARDLEALLHADAELVDRRLKVERVCFCTQHRCQQRARLRLELRSIDEPEPRRLAAQHQVFRDRHLGHERELLMHDRDARAPRIERRAKRLDRAVDHDLAA